MLDFRVLGPFEVVVDGSAVPVGGPQQRSVLALLSLRANEVVSTDTIVDGLWGETVPRSAVGVVRNYVSRLRRVLAVTRRARLASRPPGYVLETDPDHVDAFRFTLLVRRARQALDAGKPDEASAMLRKALGLWRARCSPTWRGWTRSGRPSPTWRNCGSTPSRAGSTPSWASVGTPSWSAS